MTDNSSQELEIIAEDSEILELGANFLQNQSIRNNRFQPYRRRTLTHSEMNNQTSSNVIPTEVTNVIPTEVMSRQDLQLLLNSIPEYSPGQNLSIFINEVDNLLLHLQGRLNPDLNYAFNFSIRSKLKNEARDFIAFQNASDWPTIRRVLLQRYGDQRNEDLLISSLSQCVQHRSENYLDFYSRLSKNLNDLLQHLTLNIQDPNYLLYKKQDIQKLALKTFQIGILEPYRSYLSNFDSNTIEECINRCKFFDNRKQEWEYCEFLRKSQETPKKPIHIRPQPSNYPNRSNHYNNFTPNYFNNPPNFTNPATNSQFNNNSRNPPGFPHSINKPISNNQRFPTNREVFGIKPGSNIYKNQPKPTPMSISTRNTSKQPQQTPMSISTRTFQRNPNQSQQPKFYSEELFNVQTENDDPECYETEYYNAEIEQQPDCENYYEDDENFQMNASESQEI